MRKTIGLVVMLALAGAAAASPLASPFLALIAGALLVPAALIFGLVWLFRPEPTPAARRRRSSGTGTGAPKRKRAPARKPAKSAPVGAPKPARVAAKPARMPTGATKPGPAAAPAVDGPPKPRAPRRRKPLSAAARVPTG